MRSSKWWENLSGQKETSESREQKLTQGREVGGGMQGGKGCRESEAPETQAETPVNPVLGENRPKHQLFQRLWESKCLWDPDPSAGHRNEQTWFQGSRNDRHSCGCHRSARPRPELLFTATSQPTSAGSTPPLAQGIPNLDYTLWSLGESLLRSRSHLHDSLGSGRYTLQIPRSCQRAPECGSHRSRSNISPGGRLSPFPYPWGIQNLPTHLCIGK